MERCRRCVAAATQTAGRNTWSRHGCRFPREKQEENRFCVVLRSRAVINRFTSDWILGGSTCHTLGIFPSFQTPKWHRADVFHHLGFRCGLQVAQTVAESLGSQAELPMLLLDGGHALEHHLIILPVEQVKTGVTTKIVPQMCSAYLLRSIGETSHNKTLTSNL